MKLITWLCDKAKGKHKYTLEMFVDVSGAWRWRLRHLNGNILATSEAYSDKSACGQTAGALRTATGFPLIEA